MIEPFSTASLTAVAKAAAVRVDTVASGKRALRGRRTTAYSRYEDCALLLMCAAQKVDALQSTYRRRSMWWGYAHMLRMLDQLISATDAFVIARAEVLRVAPPRPRSAFGANGTMGPIFCVIDNPKALDYYKTLGRRTLALGPDATPNDVESALSKDYTDGGTYPIICAVYQLAAWRNHWTFGVSPAAQYGGCSDPDFSSVN